jgi:ISXO2 transposase-like protein/transposase-like zinc ribbon protein
MTDFPRSLIEFQRRFPDDGACAAYLAEARWPDGFRCPECSHDKGWQLATKAFTRECANCRRQTSVTAGTVMHGSKLPLTVWFWGAYLMATHSNGMSARQLWRQLGLGSYKTAWLMCAKLRRAMVAPDRSPLSGLVEIDETEIPHRTKDDPPAGGQGRSTAGKMLVIGAVEVHDRGPGRLRLAPIADFSAASLHAFIGGNVEAGATAKTDGWPAYRGAPGIAHDPHVVGSMAAHVVLPWAHRVFANLKTWALGVYHGLRRKHLQSYLDEFVFRFNRRRTRHAAFRSLLGIALAVKHATYNMLISPEATA